MIPLVECQLCPRYCRLKNGERGNCRARMNIDGKLQSLVYGNPCSVNVDPIEKKPLYHVLPSTKTFSIATAGCNLHCKYCQNWSISQRSPEETENIDLPPEKVVAAALQSGSRSIAYTYTDPVVFYEYTLDTCKLARAQNLLNVLVTAGYINTPPLLELCPVVDAAHIDLKGITDDFYRKMSGGTLKPVQDSIITMHQHGVWVEIINLIIPTWNDDPKDIRALCRWLKDNIGVNQPLHFSRFWPMHQLQNLPPTPIKILIDARDIAISEGLRYVYIGNAGTPEGNNTYCPKCKKLIVKREGYLVLQNHILDGKCEFCKESIAGIWK